MLQDTVSHQKENDSNTQKENFELLPHIEKQLTDCDVVETSKDRKLVGSKRYKELMDKINLNHLNNATKINTKKNYR